jgi:hypothetical protein
MNNSEFTLGQIKSILPALVQSDGITYSSNWNYEYSSDTLVELNMDEFFIEYIIQEGDHLIIEFYCMAYYDSDEVEYYYFKTLQEISTVKNYING